MHKLGTRAVTTPHLMHQQARRGAADLAGGPEAAKHGPLHGRGHVGVVKHDEGRLAAQFHGGGPQVVGGGHVDAPPCGDRAGEGDLVDQRVGGQGGACDKMKTTVMRQLTATVLFLHERSFLFDKPHKLQPSANTAA